jgi:hypothetical protein
MAWELAIVEIDGKRYYDDTRLKEYREIVDWRLSIKYSDVSNRSVKIIKERVDDLQKKRLRQNKSNHL